MVAKAKEGAEQARPGQARPGQSKENPRKNYLLREREHVGDQVLDYMIHLCHSKNSRNKEGSSHEWSGVKVLILPKA